MRYLMFVVICLGACTVAPTTPELAPVDTPGPIEVAIPKSSETLRLTSWDKIPNWPGEDLNSVFAPLLYNCAGLRSHSVWQSVCQKALIIDGKDQQSIKSFFETNFNPYQVFQVDGSEQGVMTGYYEPILKGSRKFSKRYRFPIYSVPNDLIAIDAGEINPDQKGIRTRGRKVANKYLPYYTRAEIEKSQILKGKEIAWVEDQVELFFLHVQGSGQVVLESGETIRVGYADQNGHPYRSIGKYLVERGALPLEKASMQGIKNWGKQNPEKLKDLLNQNPSYIFFRELKSVDGPIGALGIPLAAGRSMAVDPRFIPLGTPVFVETTWPGTNKPLNRLMLAQDTGTAIKGAVRGDFFWGLGESAGEQAGRMKQSLKMWALLPKNI